MTDQTLTAVLWLVVPIGGFLLMIALVRLAYVRAVNGLLAEKQETARAFDAHASSCETCKARAAVGFFAPPCAAGDLLWLAMREAEVRFWTRDGSVPRFYTRKSP